MPWVKFTKDYDWWPSPQVTISYSKDMVLNVTRRCAEAAKGAGAAVGAVRPRPQGEAKP